MKIYNFKNDKKIIIEQLQNNKAILMETDTVLGLFSKNEELLYKLKQRPKEKKIVKLVNNLNEIDDINNLPSDFLKLTRSFWPGKLTIIYKNIAYRIPNHPDVIELLKHISPLYCTSANLSGYPTFKNSYEGFDIFTDFIKNKDLMILKGKSLNNKSSTIYNLDEHKIIRQGDISIKDIDNVLKE